MMIRAVCCILAIALTVSSQTAKQSPCPNVFSYEPPVTGEKLEPGTSKWYGMVTLTTDITLHALWLNIILDNKANILGNWVGEVTTEDNFNFKIENTKMKLTPGTPVPVRFFIQYNSNDVEPKLQSILFNGREICNIEDIPPVIIEYPISISNHYEVSNQVPVRIDTKTTTIRSTTVLATRNIYDGSQTKRQTTTANPNYWTQAKAEPVPTSTQKTPSKYETAKNDNKTQVNSNLWNWVQPIVANTQQAKPVENVQAKNKDQKHNAASNTQMKSQSWSQNKTVNEQTKNETKAQSAQSTSQAWSSKSNNNQQAKSDKLQVTTDSNSRVTSYTKPQTWETIKGEYNRQTTENKQYVVSEDKNKYDWSQEKGDSEHLKSENKQSNYGNYQASTGISHNKGEVWSPTRTETSQQTSSKYAQNEPEVRPHYYSENSGSHPTGGSRLNHEDTSHIQSHNTQQRKQVSTSNIGSNNQRTQPHISDSDKKVLADIFQTFGGSQQVRPAESVELRPINIVNNQDAGVFEIRPIKRKESEAVASRPTDTFAWSQDQPKVIYESTGSRNINEQSVRQQTSDGQQLTTARPTPTVVPTPILDTYDDDYSTKYEDRKEPGLIDGPMFYIPNLQPEASCGKVIKKPPRYLPYGASTSEGQWPWQVALYQQQTVDFKYICGGTLVSHRHVITAAHCVTRKKSRRQVNKNTLTVYLGKFNLRTSVEGVQVKFVNKITVHPAYNASIFRRDLAILELREPVSYTDWVRPACLWPETEIARSTIVGKTGSVVGWGFDVLGTPREELTLLEMPVVDQGTCINSYLEFYGKFTSEYTYCAGYKDATSVCNGDSGGGMVFKKGNSWYLRGVATLSIARQNEYRCDPKHYVIFTDTAKFLPWIEENIFTD